MKEIKAYIKTHKLDAVILALHKIEDLPGLSVSKVHGFGHRHAASGNASVDYQMEPMAEHAKIEILCSDAQAERIARTIQMAAHTGLRGDGKICVSDVLDVVNIETGAFGENAL